MKMLRMDLNAATTSETKTDDNDQRDQSNDKNAKEDKADLKQLGLKTDLMFKNVMYLVNQFREKQAKQYIIDRTKEQISYRKSILLSLFYIC